jgi:hypothetical protein
LQRNAGSILERKVRGLMDTKEYQGMSDEEKAKEIIKFSERSRIDARVEYVKRQVGELTGDALKAKLGELKKTGIMTKEVFEQSKINFNN